MKPIAGRVFGIAAIILISFVFVHTYSVAKDEPKEDQPPAVPREVIAIINRGGCGNCHVIPGVPGADGEVCPDLSKLGLVAGTRKPKLTAKEYIRESILDPDAFVAPGGFEKGVMPRKFGKTLSEDDLNKLVDYLASLGVAAPKGKDEARPKLTLTRPAEVVTKPFAPSPVKGGTDEQIALGKALFFDRRLSASNALSCASCHQPDKAFTDGLPVSIGYPGTALFRNTPTLLNVAHVKAVYWDGRMSGADLASVVRDHLTEPYFMAADGRLLIERMKQVPEYVELFKAAYKAEPDFGTILKALAAYVGSLHSPPTPFDRFQNGDSKELTTDAVAGKKLFEGKAGCATCHPAPLFTDHQFHDLGLRTEPKLLDDPERYVTFRRFFRGLGTPNYRNLTEDAGRYVVNFKPDDRGYKLFIGKANCVQCHDGPLLSDDRYHNLGVPPSPDFFNSPNKQITFRFEQASNGVPRKVYESARDDFGLYYVTKRAGDIGKFRTASLRELKHTAPYMHNGIFKTLPEVIDFYDQGGGKHSNKSALLKPLGLTKDEKADLLAFLESLSGDPLSDKPPPLPPYGPYRPKGGK